MKKKKLSLKDNFIRMISKMLPGITFSSLMLNGAQKELNK